MDFKQVLDSKIAEHNLLNHPFYQAWNAGELPVAALRRYAGEYGAFIGTIPEGWAQIDEPEIAAEETEHIAMWADFAAGLETRVADAQIPQVKTLTETAQLLFSDPVTALGALYAFEAQQPATTASKLDGLRAFYQLPTSVEPYFVTHAHDDYEAEKLIACMETLPPETHAAVIDACEQMSTALWDALTGIHDADRA